MLSAAKLGAHMVMFADRPWEMRAPVIGMARSCTASYHGTAAPHIMLTEFCVCGPDLARDRGRGAAVPGQVRGK